MTAKITVSWRFILTEFVLLKILIMGAIWYGLTSVPYQNSFPRPNWEVLIPGLRYPWLIAGAKWGREIDSCGLQAVKLHHLFHRGCKGGSCMDHYRRDKSAGCSGWNSLGFWERLHPCGGNRIRRLYSLRLRSCLQRSWEVARRGKRIRSERRRLHAFPIQRITKRRASCDQ